MITIHALGNSDIDMNDIAWGLSIDDVETMPETSEDAINAILEAIGQPPIAYTVAENDTLVALTQDSKILSFTADGVPHVFMFTEAG